MFIIHCNQRRFQEEMKEPAHTAKNKCETMFGKSVCTAVIKIITQIDVVFILISNSYQKTHFELIREFRDQ